MGNSLFEEIYSNYYNIISRALLEVKINPVNNKYDVVHIINELANQVSDNDVVSDTIGEIVINESNLIENGTANLKNKPSLPLTTIQKRWLKSLLEDPRIMLFDISTEGLDDVDPLYYPETIVYYDQYNDGDDFTNETYINVFRTLLNAIKTHSKTLIIKTSETSKITELECWPFNLEYSAKDDKFRVLVSKDGNHESYNLSNITSVVILDETTNVIEKKYVPKTEILELEINNGDLKNTINRCMINFSDYKKETTKIDDNQYRIKIHYDQSDENELIIRVLQLGTSVRVIGPSHFKERLKQRILNQKSTD